MAAGEGWAWLVNRHSGISPSRITLDMLQVLGRVRVATAVRKDLMVARVAVWGDRWN